MKTKFLGFSFLFLLGVAGANETPPPPTKVVESPFEACKDVTIVSKETYDKNSEKWKSWKESCGKDFQVADEAGLTKLSTLNDSVKYLDVAYKVTDKILETLDKSKRFAQCASYCFKGSKTCSKETSGTGEVIQCKDLKDQVHNTMKIQSRKLRMHLALSKDGTDSINVNVRNVLTVEDEKRINPKLTDFEAVMPRPVSKVPLFPAEVDHAQGIIKRERAKVEEEYKKMLVQKKVKDTTELRSSWIATKYMDQIDKRKEENQVKYREIVYQETPIFSVIADPKEFQRDVPVWSDAQISDAFSRLVENARKTEEGIKKSVENGNLEFNRYTGRAAKEWLAQLFTKDTARNDLLYYMGMKSQVEEVLKKDPSLCATASTLFDRLGNRELQNAGGVLLASFAGGYATKSASKAIPAVFRIGRSLTGAEAMGLTGLAMGGAFLADSFRMYDTALSEVNSGVQDVEAIADARLNVGLNLVFAPTMMPTGGWAMGKALYQSLGNKMAKDSPEIAKLMEKAGTNEAVKDQIVDKWVGLRIVHAVKNKIINKTDVDSFKTDGGRKVLDSLTVDIQKTNPAFFNDPANFDYFLKVAASSIKRKAGDPADLGDKARKFFLNFNMDAFDTWDPEARLGLMKVFDEAVETLRDSYSKDPAAYAKFTSDQASQEKIMLQALKRAGVVDDQKAQAMQLCAIRK